MATVSSDSEEMLRGLRALAEALPAGAVVPVPRDWLLELLAAADASPAARPADPTVEEVATRYGRAPSTVRGWCEAGRFPGAYKLHDREWRIPAAGIEAFEVTERQRERPAGHRGRRVQSLGDWRHAS
jgi:helix-turn-helix protein